MTAHRAAGATTAAASDGATDSTFCQELNRACTS